MDHENQRPTSVNLRLQPRRIQTGSKREAAGDASLKVGITTPARISSHGHCAATRRPVAAACCSRRAADGVDPLSLGDDNQIGNPEREVDPSFTRADDNLFHCACFLIKEDRETAAQ